MKFTQKQIRQLIASGVLRDLNEIATSADAPTCGELSTVGTSCGTYGVNGAVFTSDLTGVGYGIVGRTTTLFRYL